jgi:Carbohydrate family 9 binding domain-like
MKSLILILFLTIATLNANTYQGSFFIYTNSEILKVKRCPDFKVTGNGSNECWTKTGWMDITPRQISRGETLTTKVKVLYSETGTYFLFDCQDRKLTATMNADFMDLWKEDVVEVFLWPDQDFPVYFEYEISPLNYELPILISNDKGDLVRWQPFHYDDDRKTQHATKVYGGKKKNGASIASWTAEFFIPYKLLKPLNNILPEPGTKWRANFYRVDYDNGQASWSWQLTDKSFHEYEKFGTLLFE